MTNNINRIKAVLAETGHTGKWLQFKLNAIRLRSQNGVPIPYSQICKCCLKSHLY